MPAETKKMQYVEIVGGYTRFVTQVVEKETSTEEFMEKLLSTAAMDSGVLPSGTVFYSRRMVDTHPLATYVFEYPAAKRTVRCVRNLFGAASSGGRLDMYFPNLLLVVSFIGTHIANGRLFCTEAPLRHNRMETKLYYVPLPNQYNDGRMCFGQLEIPSESSIDDKAATVQAWLFESIWNADLMPYFAQTEIRDLTGWAAAPDAATVQRNIFFRELYPTFDALIKDTATLRRAD